MLTGSVIVIPILDAISNCVCELATANSDAQTSSVPRAGGFAASLAAAQGLSIPSQGTTGQPKASGGSVAQNAGSVSNLQAQGSASGIAQLKKPLNSNSVAVSAAAAVNVVVPGYVPVTEIQIATNPSQSGPAQPSLVQTSPAQASLVQPSLAQPSLSPALAAAVQARTPEVATRAGESGLQTVAYDTTTQSAAVGDLLPSPAVGRFGAVSSPSGIAGSSSNPSMAGVFIPEVSTSQANETSMVNADQPSGLFAAAAFPTESTAPVENTTTSAENTLAPALSATNNVEIASGMVWPKTDSDNLKNGTNPGSSSPVSSVISFGANGTGSGSVEETPPIDQAVEPAVSGPAFSLSASANSAGERAASFLPSSTVDLNSGQANPAPAVTPDAAAGTVAPADSLPAEPPSGNPLPLIASAKDPIPASSILNTPVQATLQTAVRTMTGAVASPSVREANLGTVARTSIATSPSSAGSASGKGLSMADQTPFSVFFSGPGPGTESAASALPRMILPGTSSGIRDNHANSGNAASVGSQAGASPSDASQSNTSQSNPQNAAPTNVKDSLTPTASGGLQATQSSRRDVDGSAASVQVAGSPSAAGAVQAPSTSAPVAVPLATPAAIANDSLPKSDPLPTGAPAPSANSIAASGESPAAAVPGPVQVAQLVNRIGQSEMRIGMNTSAFGTVEVRTVVHANDVGLVIGSEKGDLRTLLSNDIPAITSTLQQQNLRLNSVNFMQGFAFSNNNSGGGDSPQRSFVPARTGANLPLSEATAEESADPLPAWEFGSGGSLSILA